MKPNPFRATQLEALANLRSAVPDATIALIGAGALSCHLPATRETKDIDLVVSLTVDDPGGTESVSESFAAIAAGLDWQRHPRKEHEWTTTDGERIDVLPISPRSLRERRLVWGSGHVMNLAGIRHALQAEPLELEGLRIALPSVAVIALLKIIAYLDRPAERERDLKDLASILSSYPPTDDDAFFADDLLERGFAEHESRAWMLGRSLRALVDASEAALVTDFLERMLRDEVDTARFVANSPWRFRPDEAVLRLALVMRAFQPT